MKLYEHPKKVDISKSRDISPKTKHSSDVCEKNKVIVLKNEKRDIRNDRELDEALKETFPASDAITKY